MPANQYRHAESGCTTRKWQSIRVARPNSFDRACRDVLRSVGRHAQAALERATYPPGIRFATIVSYAPESPARVFGLASGPAAAIMVPQEHFAGVRGVPYH